MSRFKTADHLVSWAGVAPGQYESAGKKKNVSTRKGNKYLHSVLVEAARSAVRQKGTFLSEKYQRLKRQKGANKAIVAIARTLLVNLYHMTTKNEPCREKDAQFYHDQTKVFRKERAVKVLQRLGYTADLSSQSA